MLALKRVGRCWSPVCGGRGRPLSSEGALPLSAVPGPPTVPGLGTLWLYKTGLYDVSRYHEELLRMYRKYGPVVREVFGSNTVIHLFDPDDVRKVHQTEGKYPTIPPLQDTLKTYREKNDMSLGLGNTNGERWYQLRSAVQQLLMRPKEVSAYLPLSVRAAGSLTDRLSDERDADGRVPDLTSLVLKWALESATFICTERSFGALSGGERERAADRLIASNRRVMQVGARLKFSLPVYRYLTTPRWRRLVEAENYLTGVVMGLLESALDEIEQLAAQGQLTEDRFKFMCFLMSRPNISRKDVLIIAFSMFNDGLSTTVPALLAGLWCLAHSPDAQQRVYREICEVAPSDPNLLTPNHINRLSTVKAVMKETLRLYPIGTETSRITDRDLELGGYLIPAGTHVDLNQWVQLRSDRWFSDPDRFAPERWLGRRRTDLQPYLHIPFGHGTRMCAGRRFAEQDFYVVLTRLLSRFELRPDDGATSGPLRQKYETLLMPDPPVRIRLIPRH